MNRGDTATMNFNVNVELPENVIVDKLYLGITEPNQYFEDALIKKTFEINKDITITTENNIWSFSIQINPEDTVDIIPGTYYYEVKASGVIDQGEERSDFAITIVQKTKFIIVE